MEDGCPNAGHSPIIPSLYPGISASYKAAVRCCSYGGDTCFTPMPCLETTYAEARSKCNELGRRLCTPHELKGNKCCKTGCGFDNKLTWAIFVTGWFF